MLAGSAPAHDRRPPEQGITLQKMTQVTTLVEDLQLLQETSVEKVQLIRRKYTFKHWIKYGVTLRVGGGKFFLVDLQKTISSSQRGLKHPVLYKVLLVLILSCFALYLEASLGSLLGLLQSSASGVVL